MKIKFTTCKTWMLAAVTVFAVSGVKAQTVSTFENVTLAPNSYYNGKDMKGGFNSGNAFFASKYDTSFGGYWAAGFAASNVKDSVKAGFSNMYASRAGSGYNSSSNYIVGQNNAIIRLTGKALNNMVKGFYVTNSTFAAQSMKNGDQFAKKFGGATGNDPDFFKLVVNGYSNGQIVKDSVVFYLADFRSSDNSKDYIVTKWTWLDVASLGKVDSLVFSLASSDVGQFGINTPTYFCIDDFTTTDGVSTIAALNQESATYLYPNPASDFINIKISNINATGALKIYDMAGREVYNQTVTEAGMQQFAVSQLEAGTYFITIQSGNQHLTAKFIKQ